MSKPAAKQPTRPHDADDDNAPVTPEVERIIRERLAQPEGPTRPWPEVLADLQARRPLPR
jgi:hypothetical protein